MELNHLRYFYEVAKAGSFTKAARSMRISQSAISKIVALLEGREGAQLLHRSKSGVSLTAIGAEVYSKCEGIFAQVAEIESICRGFQEVCEGNLRIGASDHVANYLLAPQLARMQSRYPRLFTSIFSGPPNDIVELILKNDLELGLFFTKVNVPGITYEPVREFEMSIVCRPDLLPLASGKITSAKLGEAIDQAGYISSIRKHYSRHPSETLFSLMGRDPRVSFESSSQETQKRLCLQGGGFAFLARFMIEAEIAAGELVEAPMPKKIRQELYLAKRKGTPTSFNARTFLQELA